MLWDQKKGFAALLVPLVSHRANAGIEDVLFYWEMKTNSPNGGG